jgi:hypothetical protein
MRVHHLNNVNKALQILEQNNVSVKFQLKIMGCFCRHNDIYYILNGYIKITASFELCKSSSYDVYF